MTNELRAECLRSTSRHVFRSLNFNVGLPAQRLQFRRSFFCALVLILAIFTSGFSVAGQKKTQPSKRRARPAAKATQRAKAIERVDFQRIQQAMGVICAERASDPNGSDPIDQMQTRASLELNHPEALMGAQRAQRLLPVAKELVIEALRQLAAENNINARQIQAASRRVREVNEVEPDPDLRDNAAVIMTDPHTIRFGTIFLVGLPSDEGMTSVLAHELTHIADGRQNSLHFLFNKIGWRAARLTGLRINGQKPEELACDLVGVRATRFLISRTTSSEPIRQRLARTLEHNCVDDDETDEEHLSPRSTMRAVLSLDPILVRDLLGQENQVTGQAGSWRHLSAFRLPVNSSIGLSVVNGL